MSSNERSAGHIGVYLIDDHPAIRDAIRDRIEGLMDMEVCGETGSSEEAVQEIEEIRPEVIVVDISLEDGHGLELIKDLGTRYPDVQSVVFSMYDEKIYAERALRAGASGYLMKSDATDALVEAIRSANEGNVYLSKKMTSRILGKVGRQTGEGPSFPIDELTDREMSVFQMLGQGYSIEEIQDRLSLARKTVETYRRRAKDKLGFDTVSELLRYAVQWTYGQGTDQEEDETAGPPVPARQ
jgi:DNA-binding NarL/FixJ family response regulator